MSPAPVKVKHGDTTREVAATDAMPLATISVIFLVSPRRQQPTMVSLNTLLEHEQGFSLLVRAPDVSLDAATADPNNKTQAA